MNRPAPTPWLHRFAVLVSVCTFLLIIAGASVTSNRAGLAVPDWPTTYGEPLFTFPFSKMVGGIFYEHGHRLIASVVGLLTIVLACWTVTVERRRHVRWLAIAALAAVIAQGVLGGLTVIFFLPPAVSVAHAGLAQAFFCLTIALALLTGRRWQQAATPVRHGRLLRRFALATTLLVYFQIILGATIRHAETAVLAHILGAMVVLVCAWTAGVGLYTGARRRELVAPAAALGLLVFLQLWVGVAALVVRVPKADHGQLDAAQVWWPTAHLALGSLILAASFILTLKTYRLVAAEPAAQADAADVPARPRAGLAAYLELTKPRIVTMVLVTTTLGFFLGNSGLQPVLLLAWTLAGVGLATAGSAVLNNYLERDVDRRMNRTCDRVLPAGRLPPENALGFGVSLVLGGLFLLVTAVNLLTAFVVLLAVFLYVVVYTPLKRLTWLNTTFGAIPGAIPPLAGWVAATGQVETGAWILFAILFAWQHPHFYAIAWMFRDDYARAGLKMLPVTEPSGRGTFRQTVLFSVLLLAVSLLPTGVGLTGRLYGGGALLLGLGLLVAGLVVARTKAIPDARRLLRASVVYLPLLLLLIFADVGL